MSARHAADNAGAARRPAPEVATVMLDLAIGVGIATRPASLGVIRNRGVAAAIWRRALPEGLGPWLDGLAPERLPALRAEHRPAEVADAVRAGCEAAGTPRCAARDALVEDAAGLARLFAEIMGARTLGLRLDVVRTDACRRFHLDRVRARLLCTYRGPGTQYGKWRDGGDPDPVFAVPTGAAAIFRGALWPGSDRPGVVHRSPPLGEGGAARLLLVLDPLDGSPAPQAPC